MSVRSAFSFIGYAVGGWFGVPQLGAFIGGIVGNIVDPQVIRGPELGDATVQTTRAGVPIALLCGRISVVGTVIESGPVEHFEVEHQQGKGGGPVTIEERARQTFAILFARNLMGGGFAGFEVVKFDGKIVFDARPKPTMLDYPDDAAGLLEAEQRWHEAQATSKKFLEKCRFYLGTSDQMPDPAIEAIRGVGTTPAYRRSCYAVFEQWDITDYGQRIPQVEVVLVTEGSASTTANYQPKCFGGSPNPWSAGNLGLRDPRKAGVTYLYGYYQGSDVEWFDTLDEAIAYAQEAHASPYQIHISGEPKLMGWTVAGSGEFVPGCHVDRELSPWDVGEDANGFQAVLLCFSRYPYEDEVGVISIDAGGTGPAPPNAAAWSRGVVHGVRSDGTTRFRSGVIVPYTPSGTGPWYGAPPYNDGHYGFTIDGESYGEYAWLGDFGIHCRAVPDCGLSTVEMLPVPDTVDVWFDPNMRLFHAVTEDGCDVVAGTFKQLQILTVSDSDVEGFMPIETHPLGPVVESGSVNDGETFWEAAYARAVSFGQMEAGLIYGVDYPVTVTSACDCPLLVPSVDASTLILADVQAAICARANLPAEKIDVSDLTDLVRGYRIAKQTTAAAASRPLQDAYIYDRGEWDSKLRFIKRGGPVQFTFSEDDLLEEEDLQELTREQSFELPRKLHTVAFEPTSLVPVPQTAERFSPDVLSVSEETVPLPLVLTVDENKQCADRLLKIRQANQQGAFRLRTWTKYLHSCATNVFAFSGKRYHIERWRYADGIIEIEARFDRQSAYTSTLTGVPIPDPTRTRSRLGGPTLFVAMNLPSLRPQDNVAGVYVAACGVLDSWPGAAIFLSVDGGVTYSVVTTITVPTPMGYLTQSITDGSESPSPSLFVNIFGGDLSSATDDQLAVRYNLSAIVDPDGVAELVQFATATETGEGLYELEEVERGMLQTTAVEHFIGDQFVHLRNAIFIPIDPALGGQTLYFRAVTSGTEEEANPIFTLVFDPPTFIRDGGEI